MDVRPIDVQDLELICRHREAMFREAGRDEAALRSMTTHFRAWLAPRLASGAYFGYVLSERGVALAGIGLMLIDWPPHPLHPETDRRGYVLNVYVEPEARRRGLARTLMTLADEAFAQRGVTYAILHATEQGRPLYQGLGWSGTTEMAKALDAPPPA
ncbi:ribosomal protein S18 acetylase RimI-like enzyme [Paraburkholderia unamae]|uniref:GNAT family N-acetyltransferase n=1 Tax=Paraburkholderia unamae TaxID=219649 RepID=UPI000DC32C7A|nr:GNAT family N-acetyltransferase [Paraburkholderia unamae]RAR66042.1 ribosomal protein S18 acetylase RimI-like enzyme [Paraburkholderia unamae]